jgi:hypothetical protein
MSKIVIVLVSLVIIVVGWWVVATSITELQRQQRRQPIVALSPTQQYKAIAKRGPVNDRIIIRKTGTQEIIDSLDTIGKAQRLLWSPQEDLLVIETLHRRIQIRDISKQQDIPLDCKLYMEGAATRFYKWQDKGFDFYVQPLEGGAATIYTYDLDKEGVLSNKGILFLESIF